MKSLRQIQQIFQGMPASDGDGVKLTRIIGTPYLDRFDPFLLLDAFGSDKSQDYIGGFPAHPHRGFETVTYMLAGKMRHKDSVGNEGVIESGGIQWMTAGSGIIHSEMPEQTDGLLAGFQLWVNLPARAKMMAPFYQEKTAQEIPTDESIDGVKIKVIAGQSPSGITGVIDNQFVEPVYLDICFEAETSIVASVPAGHNAFIYVYSGQAFVNPAQAQTSNAESSLSHADKTSDTSEKPVSAEQLALLGDGDAVKISAAKGTKLLLIAGKPLNEPIERAGPFVMNTREEIERAFFDYQTGQFIQ